MPFNINFSQTSVKGRCIFNLNCPISDIFIKNLHTRTPRSKQLVCLPLTGHPRALQRHGCSCFKEFWMGFRNPRPCQGYILLLSAHIWTEVVFKPTIALEIPGSIFFLQWDCCISRVSATIRGLWEKSWPFPFLLLQPSKTSYNSSVWPDKKDLVSGILSDQITCLP